MLRPLSVTVVICFFLAPLSAFGQTHLLMLDHARAPGAIRSFDLTSQSLTTIAEDQFASHFAVDRSTGRVFWSSEDPAAPHSIWSVDFGGANRTQVVSDAGRVLTMAFDTPSQLLYWASVAEDPNMGQSIQRATPTGQNRETLFFRHDVNGLFVDTQRDRLFVLDLDDNEIFQSNLAGEFTGFFVGDDEPTSATDSARAMFVDLENDALYWIDNHVHRATLSTSQFSTVALISATPSNFRGDLEVVRDPDTGQETIYWSDVDADAIFRIRVGESTIDTVLEGVHASEFALVTIPEPGSLCLMFAGLIAVVAWRCPRRT